MEVAERPAKRTKLMDDSSSEESDAGVQTNGGANGFSINEEYARRFEHNKKREEKHRLEEKYEKFPTSKRKRGHDAELGASEDEDEDSSSDEDEDDDAELATADLDDEIFATLNAIKTKDPRVYDKEAKFYRDFDSDAVGNDPKKEKPMYLHDYHRQNLLAGNGGTQDEEEDEPMQTYQDEQDQLKRELVGSMHATANGDAKDDEDADDFMVKKTKPRHEAIPASRTKKAITEEDIKTADKDPETFLSNFMAARAWLPSDGSRFEAFESDDSGDERRADEFEEAYNMRFEDPEKANEKLLSFARDVGKYGARRDEKSGRAKGREREKEKKEAEKREREEEKARLRKLKIEEAEEKVHRIKEAAGIRGQELNLGEWKDVIEGDFDDDKWEQEMKRRFGDDYYAGQDEGIESEMEEDDGKEKPKKPKKPSWDDDIDIKDLVPDFDDEEKAEFSLSEDEDEDEAVGAPLINEDVEEDEVSKKKKNSKKEREKAKSDAKRAARKERRAIEEMVDASLPIHDPTLTSAASSKAPVVGFRYRETSPTTFGMSSRDILFADDSQLNQFAGLKKLHSFRDADRKERDRKKLGKKQRLQKWRKDTFGESKAPTGGFERVLGGEADAGAGAATDGGADKDGSKKKRKRKNKKVNTEAAKT